MKKIIITIFVLLLFIGGYAYARDAAEEAKINYLIGSVENLKGVAFVRNGTEYDSQKAAEHLRLKLKRAGSRVKTADDFIGLCATKSLISGEPYTMRFPDGSTLTSEAFLRDRLKKFDSANQGVMSLP